MNTKANGLKIQKNLLDHIEAISFLQNSWEIKKYLTEQYSEEKECKILKLRTKILWFHCALLKLEGFEYLVKEYSKEIQEEMEDYLELYYYSKEASSSKYEEEVQEEENNYLQDYYHEEPAKRVCCF